MSKFITLSFAMAGLVLAACRGDPANPSNPGAGGNGGNASGTGGAGLGGQGGDGGQGGGVVALSAPPFRVADAGKDGSVVHLWLDPDWPSWTAADLKIVYRIGPDGAPTNISPVMPGLHSISGLNAGTEVAVQVQAIQGSNSSPWADAKTATPSVESFDNLAVFANEFHDIKLEDTVVGLGQTAATILPDNINKPFALPSGAEVEYIGGNSTFVIKNQTTLQGGTTPESRHRHFDPLGRYHDKQPLEVTEESFGVASATNPAGGSARAAVLGRVVRSTREALVSVALDKDGDARTPSALMAQVIVGNHRCVSAGVLLMERSLSRRKPTQQLALGSPCHDVRLFALATFVATFFAAFFTESAARFMALFWGGLAPLGKTITRLPSNATTISTIFSTPALRKSAV